MKTILPFILFLPFFGMCQLTASLSSDVSGCTGSNPLPITFTASNGTSPYIFYYNINGGGTQTVSTTSGNSVTVYVPVSNAGTFNYQLTQVTDYLGSSQSVNDYALATVNPTPTVNPNVDQMLCSNTSSSAVAFSGTVSGTTFNWTNSNSTIGLTSSGTGDIPSFTATNSTSSPITATITVTPVANSCTGLPDQFTITVNPVPMVFVNNATICAGSAVTITATPSFAGGGGTYNWSTGATTGTITVNPTETTTFTVTYSLNGCTSQTAISVITVNPLPNVNAGPDQTVNPGVSTTLTASGASTYSWNNGVSNGVPFYPTNTMTYTVTGTSVEGCVSSDQVTVFISTAGIGENELIDLKLFPNPVHDFVKVQGEILIETISIYNLNGFEVLKIEPNLTEVDLDLSNLNSGIYLITIITENGSLQKKIIVE